MEVLVLDIQEDTRCQYRMHLDMRLNSGRFLPFGTMTPMVDYLRHLCRRRVNGTIFWFRTLDHSSGIQGVSGNLEL
jgi:hypothetical protein